MNKNKFQHIHWQIPPFGVDATQGVDDLHLCIFNILSTPKGSDILRPDFGSDHFNYIDYPFDEAVPNFVREIFLALEKWEPRINLQKVEVSGSAPTFLFSLFWSIKDDLSNEIFLTEVPTQYE